jgi:hypothetical protein
MAAVRKVIMKQVHWKKRNGRYAGPLSSRQRFFGGLFVAVEVIEKTIATQRLIVGMG